MTDTSPALVKLTPSRRVHRVSHRTGVVLAVPLMLAAAWCLVGASIAAAPLILAKEPSPVVLTIEGRKVAVDASYLTLTPEAQKSTIAEISAQLRADAALPAAKGLFDDLIPNPDAPWENDPIIGRDWSDTQSWLYLCAFWLASAVGGYAIIRSFGWIVAGAMKD